MHVCSKCGREFEGKFCPECGEKWVDPNTCPKCGAALEEGATFCSECGAQLVNDKTAAKEKRRKIGEKVRSYFSLSGIICLLIASLIGLIFVFVMGVVAESEIDSQYGDHISKTTRMLYYYFGDAYDDISNRTSFMAGLSGARKFGLYLPAVMGTIVSVCGILGVVAMAALTVYKTILKFVKGKEVNVATYAMATFLVFVVVATLILAINVCNWDIEQGFSEETYDIEFSGATLAGIIVGSVFAGLGVILLMVSKYHTYKNFPSVFSIVATVAVSAFVIVILSLTAVSSIDIEASNRAIGKAEYDYGMFYTLQQVALTIGESDIINKTIAYCTIGGLTGFAIAILSGVMLYRKTASISRGEKKNDVILCAVLTVLSVVYLVMTVLAADEVYNLTGIATTDGSNYMRKEYGVPIAMIVMSACAFAVELAAKILVKTDNGTSTPIQETSNPVEEHPDTTPIEEPSDSVSENS